MNRSTNIKSRVFRNLQNYDLKNSNVQDPEIYDEIAQGQNRIISDVFPDKIITIDLITGQDEYLLTTDDINVVTENNKQNIASVKIIKIPSGWTSTVDDYGNLGLLGSSFNIIPNKYFVEYVNSATASTGQPRAGTVINGKLKIYPVPTIDYNGDQLELYTYLSAAAGAIDKDTIPEIPEYCDKALEFFATAQFLIGVERNQWDNKTDKEIARINPIQNRKHHNLQRGTVSGW